MKQFGSRLNVLTKALVTRITFDERQATGIEYFSNGQTKRAVATREVLLSCFVMVISKLSGNVDFEMFQIIHVKSFMKIKMLKCKNVTEIIIFTNGA